TADRGRGRPAGDARPGRRVPTLILPARRGWAHDSGESGFLVLLPGVLRKAPHLRLAGGPRPGAVARFGLPFPSAFIIPRAAARGRRRGRAERLRIPWTRAMIGV